MKKQIIFLLCFMLIGITLVAQSGKKTGTIKVYGNCGMCKKTIEAALTKKDGILSKKWDVNTKILSFTYDSAKINPKKVGEKIAAVGYDNEMATAPDEVYNKLHACCQYERPKK